MEDIVPIARRVLHPPGNQRKDLLVHDFKPKCIFDLRVVTDLDEGICHEQPNAIPWLRIGLGKVILASTFFCKVKAIATVKHIPNAKHAAERNLRQSCCPESQSRIAPGHLLAGSASVIANPWEAFEWLIKSDIVLFVNGSFSEWTTEKAMQCGLSVNGYVIVAILRQRESAPPIIGIREQVLPSRTFLAKMDLLKTVFPAVIPVTALALGLSDGTLFGFLAQFPGFRFHLFWRACRA